MVTTVSHFFTIGELGLTRKRAVRFCARCLSTAPPMSSVISSQYFNAFLLFRCSLSSSAVKNVFTVTAEKPREMSFSPFATDRVLLQVDPPMLALPQLSIYLAQI